MNKMNTIGTGPDRDVDMTTDQVAKGLGCCRETVINKYIVTGRIDAFKTGHGYRIPASSYRALRAELMEEQRERFRKRLERKNLKKAV